MEYLGCNLREFKEHIESTFSEGMTFGNYGLRKTDWQIDHKIPIKYGNPTFEETIQRLHYTNTRACWVVDNAAKGNRYITE
tara:strand:+ start:226 stop:468 length:243 start_codon:yes stop_codon:yes gene_type:complete